MMDVTPTVKYKPTSHVLSLTPQKSQYANTQNQSVSLIPNSLKPLILTLSMFTSIFNPPILRYGQLKPFPK